MGGAAISSRVEIETWYYSLPFIELYFTEATAVWAGHFQGIVTLLKWLITCPLTSCLITLLDLCYNYYLESFIT